MRQQAAARWAMSQIQTGIYGGTRPPKNLQTAPRPLYGPHRAIRERIAP